MRLAHPVCGALLALVAIASATRAQSTSSPSGAGSAAPAAGASGGPVTATDLDLPLERPEYQPAAQPPAPPAPTPPPEDPRDTPPPTIYGEEIVSENDTIVYVIDRSGSMDWDPASYVGLDGQRRNGTRMDRAKAEITRSILGLSANFRFDIVAFDCAMMQWRGALVPADDANKQAALAWVQTLVPGGGTGTGPATAMGLAIRENLLVVLLTDGAPNCGVAEFDSMWSAEDVVLQAHRRMVSGANTQGAKINVFGIAASGGYRQFCQQVAADSGGSYVDVP